MSIHPKLLERYTNYFNNREHDKLPCAVFTGSRNKALNTMKEKGAVLIIEGSDCLIWTLDGDDWIWRRYRKPYLRGDRFSKIIVDKNIDEDFFKYAMSEYCGRCYSMEVI